MRIDVACRWFAFTFTTDDADDQMGIDPTGSTAAQVEAVDSEGYSDIVYEDRIGFRGQQ